MIIALRLVVAVLVAGVVVGSVGGAMAASAQPGTGMVIVSKAVCEDDAQQGETDFQIESRNPPTESATVTGARAFQSSGTGERCTRPDGGYTFTLTTLDTGDARSQELTGGIVATFVGVPPGTYTLTEEPAGDLGGVSAPFTVAAGSSVTINVINYVPETTGNPTPDPGGDEEDIIISKQVCRDDARAGTVDFLVFNFTAQATADECRFATAGEASFTLTAADGDPTFGPTATNESGIAGFVGVPPGGYTLTENETGAVSEPFDVNQDLQFISVVNYVGAPVTPTLTPTIPPATSTTKPTTTPHPTQDPGGGKATHPPQDSGGGGRPRIPRSSGLARHRRPRNPQSSGPERRPRRRTRPA